MSDEDTRNRFDKEGRRGRRINIFGVWQPGIRFDYALMFRTLKAKTYYVQLMNWQATLAQAHW